VRKTVDGLFEKLVFVKLNEVKYLSSRK